MSGNHYMSCFSLDKIFFPGILIIKCMYWDLIFFSYVLGEQINLKNFYGCFKEIDILSSIQTRKVLKIQNLDDAAKLAQVLYVVPFK